MIDNIKENAPKEATHYIVNTGEVFYYKQTPWGFWSILARYYLDQSDALLLEIKPL